MKKRGLLLIIVAALLFVAAVCAVFWFSSKSRDIARYLPPSPVAKGITITGTDAQVFNHFAVRHFRFTAAESNTPAAVAGLFEVQLNAAGWEKLNDCSSDRISSSVWHHRGKLDGNLHLVFTVTLLDPNARDYVGSMVTQPYWPRRP